MFVPETYQPSPVQLDMLIKRVKGGDGCWDLQSQLYDNKDL